LWDLRPWQTPPRQTSTATWDDLISSDASKAYGAIWQLVDNPQSAAALLREKLPVARLAVDEKLVRQGIGDLDSDVFDTREKAAKRLAALGSSVVPLLRKSLDERHSPEVERRLRALVTELTPAPGPEDFRRMRAVQAMEIAMTREARALLRDWAGGLAYDPLTEEARGAVARVEQRDKRRGPATPP
jgi:hypothetical protein